MSAGIIVGMFVVAFLPPLIVAGRLCWLSRSATKVAAESPSSDASSSLAAAKNAGARVSFGVRFGTIAICWTLFLIGSSAWYLPYSIWPVQFFSLMPLWPAGLAIGLLSVRPTDDIATVVATPFIQVVLFLFPFFLIQIFFANPSPILAPLLIIAVVDVSAGLSLILNYTTCCGCPQGFFAAVAPRVRLNRLWRGYRIFAGAMFFFFFFNFLAATGALPSDPNSAVNYSALPPPEDPRQTSPDRPPNPEDAPGALATAIVFLFIAVGLRPAVRRRVHAFLGSLAVRGEAKAAAAVAGLVGGRNPAEALKHGLNTFRGLPYESLSLEDLSTSGDTGLHNKTVKANLGQVDAFLSHSWHDDPGQKWAALEKWGGERGGKVMLWLDKACIDQQRIDESLAALPVYLSGCQSLLVVAGPTYTYRLWCVMELFVFLQMGGEIQRVTAVALPGRDVMAQLALFDAAKASCFKPEDRERLLGIIESAFGDFGAFNTKVRTIFKRRGTTTQMELPEHEAPSATDHTWPKPQASFQD